MKIKTRNNLIRLQFVSLACPSLKRARIASRYDVHTPKIYILNLSQSISALWRYIYGTKASAERRFFFISEIAVNAQKIIERFSINSIGNYA